MFTELCTQLEAELHSQDKKIKILNVQNQAQITALEKEV
jgi:hypothetical protein